MAEKQRKTTMNLPGVTPELPHVRVGVSAVIRDKDGKFLVGKRKGSHGAGKVSSPFDSCEILHV